MEYTPFCRDFIEKNYVELKKQNPKFPFLIRECSGVEPKLYGRFGRLQFLIWCQFLMSMHIPDHGIDCLPAGMMVIKNGGGERRPSTFGIYFSNCAIWSLELQELSEVDWLQSLSRYYSNVKVGMAEKFHLFFSLHESVSYFDPRLPFSPGVFRSRDIAVQSSRDGQYVLALT